MIAVFKIQIYGLCGVDLQIARYYESVDDIILETLVVASFVWFVQDRHVGAEESVLQVKESPNSDTSMLPGAHRSADC